MKCNIISLSSKTVEIVVEIVYSKKRGKRGKNTKV